jgi:hypothetical protein
MESAHGTQQACSIRFADWKSQIQMATDLDQLVNVVGRYLAAWPPQQSRLLPWALATPLRDCDDLVGRAVVASRDELMFSGSEEDHALLREMALTLSLAASRLRMLESLRSRA